MLQSNQISLNIFFWLMEPCLLFFNGGVFLEGIFKLSISSKKEQYHCTVDELCSQKSQRISSPARARTYDLWVKSLMLYQLSYRGIQMVWQNLDYTLFMHFSVKILKRKRDFRDFRYSYGLLQKSAYL
jgi:hypothetical protein